MTLYSLKDGLKRAREEAGLTQASLTKQLKAQGIVSHKHTIENWEQGRNAPSLHTLMKLTEFYDCDLDYLTGRIDCKTHDLQFIHDQTGLTEDAILKIKSLNAEQHAALNRLIEHTDFKKAVTQVTDLSNKEAIMADLGAMIKHHILSELEDRVTVPMHGNMLEKAMLFSLSNLITQIICDVTDSEL